MRILQKISTIASQRNDQKVLCQYLRSILIEHSYVGSKERERAVEVVQSTAYLFEICLVENAGEIAIQKVYHHNKSRLETC